MSRDITTIGDVGVFTINQDGTVSRNEQLSRIHEGIRADRLQQERPVDKLQEAIRGAYDPSVRMYD